MSYNMLVAAVAWGEATAGEPQGGNLGGLCSTAEEVKGGRERVIHNILSFLTAVYQISERSNYFYLYKSLIEQNQLVISLLAQSHK